MELMNIDLRWYAAGLAVVAGGALMGASVGSTPVLQRNDHAYAIPEREPLIGDYDPDRGERPPDHYPLVTPEGTVPVAELALRGRLRNARNGWWNEPERAALDASYESDLSEAEIDRLARWEPEPVPRRASEPPVRIIRPADVGADGAASPVDPQERAPSSQDERPARVRIETAETGHVKIATAPSPSGSEPPVRVLDTRNAR